MRYLTAGQAALRLGITRKQVIQAWRRGKLKAIDLGHEHQEGRGQGEQCLRIRQEWMDDYERNIKPR